MKKILSVVFAIILVAAMIAPVFAEDDSPLAPYVKIPTKADMPNAADADAPELVYVIDEDTKYARYEDYLGNFSYIPEDQLPVSYELIKKKDPWTKGKDGDGLFASNADFAKFDAVYIDKTLVDAANYTAASGSTEVTFKKAYLETLSVGEHEIVIKSTDGYAKGTFTVLELGQTETASGNGGAGGSTHQTGDNSNTFLWVAISLVSLGAIGVVAFALAKKRKPYEN